MLSTPLKAAARRTLPLAGQVVSTVGKIVSTSGSKSTYRAPDSTEGVKMFGNQWEQPEFVFNQPNFNVLGMMGELIMDWWNGAPPKPPVIDSDILERPPRGKIDTSGCRLAFLNALRKIVQEHVEKRKAADEQAAAKAKGEAGDGTIPEPEGVTLKHSVDGVKQAQNDFAACLRKGKSTPESLVDILGDEARDVAQDLVKKRFLSQDPLKTFHQNTGTRDQEYNDAYADLQKVEVNKLAKIQAEFRKYELEASKAYRDWLAERMTIEKLVAGMTKEYKDLIKDSDGLTSMRPGVVKALEKARDTWSEAHLKAARDELKKQNDDVKKAGTKEATAFLKEMDAFEKKWLG